MDDIERQLAGLLPETRAVYLDLHRRQEEWDYAIPPEELVADEPERLARIFREHPGEQERFIAALTAIVAWRREHEI
jgi:hypothetical protein